MARLILEYENEVLKDYPFRKGSITIGRHKDNTIVLDNPEVSGYHARIDRKGPEFILTDLQSTNGTFVNREHIFSTRLAHGDKITIGDHILLFVGTERAKIEAEQEHVPLNQTVILRSPIRKPDPLPKPEVRIEEPRPQQLEISKSYRRITPIFIPLIILVALGWLMLSHGPLLMKMIFDRSAPAGTHPSPGFEYPASSLPQSDISTPTSSGEWGPSETQTGVILDEQTPSEDVDENLLKLDGIVWSDDPKHSFAMINGSIVRLGESVERMRVIDIGNDYVILESLEDYTKLRLTYK